ncbi:hypothetical protein LUZ61_015913 [Rhynchospora tenuis]|uniref:Protein-S-isoprenylcysteine O-methyltransferase n=1 Tax=Rhynchospora tenuis TaxID=198213 RepID=A0AAD6EJH6_9POAL|nr:hypothetical protein LUZ61_015913 [Rhynchospora tenuis]
MATVPLSLRPPPLHSPRIQLPKAHKPQLHPPLPPFLSKVSSGTRLSVRHFNKHLAFTPPRAFPSLPFPSVPLPSIPLPSFNIQNISLTPYTIVKFSLYLSLLVFATKTAISLVLSPFFWAKLSFAWIFYPMIISVSLACYSLYCITRKKKHLSLLDQSIVVTSAVAWLTAVPGACSNGFLEGWPLAFFFIYIYFLLFEFSVRKRLYREWSIPNYDPKWDIHVPKSHQLSFAISVLIGHWMAAFEGPKVELISGGWANLGIWVLVLMVLFTRYHSILYLSKYSQNVVEPKVVVQFGPYRLVRHPVYASIMMLFAANCVALRAPMSCLFLLLVSATYYGKKAQGEEKVMVEEFGEKYTDYMSKVKYRLIPFVY